MSWGDVSIGGAHLSDVTALAGVLVAGLAVWNTSRTTARTLEQSADMSRESRLWERRADAYQRLAEWCVHEREVVGRTLPLIGPAPELPPQMDDAALRELEAGIWAFGTKAVDDLVEALVEPMINFNYKRHVITEMDQRREQFGGSLSVSDMRTEFGETRTEAFRGLHDARQEFNRRLTLVLRQVRQELAAGKLERS